MTRFFVIPVVGDTGRTARVLIVDALVGGMVELLAPEAEPQFVDDEAGISRPVDVDARVANYMRNTTAFALQRGREQVVDTYVDALEAADHILAPSGRVLKDEFIGDNRDLLADLERNLRSVTRLVEELPTSRVLDVPDYSRRAEQQLQLAHSTLDRLATRPLRSRQAAGETSAAEHRDDQPGASAARSGTGAGLKRLGLDDRCVAALTSAGVTTVGALRKLSDTQLLGLEGIGPGLLARIRAILPSPAGSRRAERQSRPVGSAAIRLKGKGLTPHQRTLLAQAGITDLEQLATTDDAVLLAIPNFGPTTIARIRDRVPRMPKQKATQAQATVNRGTLLRRTGKGHGFLVDEKTGEQVWFHRADLDPAVEAELRVGCSVEFEIWRDRELRKAINLRLV